MRTNLICAISLSQVHRTNSHLLLSASADHSIILWNLRSMVPVIRFGGDEGHRDQVVSVDFHLSERMFVSTGIDKTLIIWKYSKPKHRIALRLSEHWHLNYHRDDHEEQFPTQNDYTPHFATRDIHLNCVDCVQWFGSTLLSRSIEEVIVMWKPGRDLDTNLRQLKFERMNQGMAEEPLDEDESEEQIYQKVFVHMERQDGSVKTFVSILIRHLRCL